MAHSAKFSLPGFNVKFILVNYFLENTIAGTIGIVPNAIALTFTISIHIAYSIHPILATETVLDLIVWTMLGKKCIDWTFPNLNQIPLLYSVGLCFIIPGSLERLLCVQHDVFFQHGFVQPKPRGLNTQISLKKRPFLSLLLLVRPYYWKRDSKKKSMGCLAESSEGVRLVQEDLDRLLLSTIADRQHTATPVSDMVGGCPWILLWCLLFLLFFCTFYVREPNHLLFSSTFYSKMHYSRYLKCKLMQPMYALKG